MCWVLIGRFTLGVRDQVRLGGSHRGPVSGSLFIGDKERQECDYIHIGPFILALHPFYGLTCHNLLLE
jgi:hypothetical protein